jgi:acetolactate synthase-1/2/3 large subunit
MAGSTQGARRGGHRMNGAELACKMLAAQGVRHVFGLPGTQNVHLYEALRRSGLRAVVAADEGGAAFMAGAYARATGRAGVVTTIPGPGFLYALAGIAEAAHDSAPLVWITQRPQDTGQAFQLQRIDHAAIAGPLVKRRFFVEAVAQIGPTLQQALATAEADEPGPVLVEIASRVLEADAPEEGGTTGAGSTSVQPDIEQAWPLLASARRPVLIVGQGAQGGAGAVRALAHRWQVPVVSTSSGRGVLDDTDPLTCVHDFSTGPGAALPDLLQRADLVLALGCKFTHNGSGGGRLDLPQHKLVRVDASAEVLASNYPARLAVRSRVEDWLARLPLDRLEPSAWAPEELHELRHRFEAERRVPIPYEPRIVGAGDTRIPALFDALDAAAGVRAVYVTDAGLHQALTRRYVTVRRPRGLLCPSDFQSMGFGLPGGIGAALAGADAGDCVIACIGDAGLLLSAGDLFTAVREDVDLVVLVFSDGTMNLIRRQQVTAFGQESGVHVHALDHAALCAAAGCSYFPVEGALDVLVQRVVATRGVRLVELRLEDAPTLQRARLQAVVRERVRPYVPDGFWRVLKRALGR